MARTYGPDEIARAAQIVALRELGLSLGQVGRVFGGNSRSLESALAEHQAALESGGLFEVASAKPTACAAGERDLE
jgi:DNA-binding transcriptional MerR regulator